jgi:hypothetical protein
LHSGEEPGLKESLLVPRRKNDAIARKVETDARLDGARQVDKNQNFRRTAHAWQEGLAEIKANSWRHTAYYFTARSDTLCKMDMVSRHT